MELETDDPISLWGDSHHHCPLTEGGLAPTASLVSLGNHDTTAELGREGYFFFCFRLNKPLDRRQSFVCVCVCVSSSLFYT